MTKSIPAVNKFLYSPLYIALYMSMVLIFWLVQIEQLSIFLTILLACYILCSQEDTLPLFPILFAVAFSFPHDIDPLTYVPLMPLLALIAAAIILHFIRFKPKLRYTKFLLPSLAISCALMLGGVGVISAADYAGGLTYALLLGFVLFALYIVIGAFFAPPRDTDVQGYTMAMLVSMGVLLSLQTIWFFIKTDQSIYVWTKANLDLGWGISNNVSTLLLMSMPACFYFAAKTKYASPFFMLLGGFMFAINVLTFSRGGILSACVVILPTVIAGGIYAKHKKVYIISAAAIFLVLVIALASAYKLWTPILASVFENKFAPSNRDKLYAEAWQGFTTYPLFGLGIGFRGVNFRMANMPMYWFHSTFFQIIGSMGLVGLIAYAYYYSVRYFIILRKKMFNVFVFLCLLGFEGYSMIDTGTFVPIPTMMIAMLLTLIVERENAISDFNARPRAISEPQPSPDISEAKEDASSSEPIVIEADPA